MPVNTKEDPTNKSLRASIIGTSPQTAGTSTQVLSSYIFGTTSSTVAAADLYSDLKTAADSIELSKEILGILQSHSFFADKLAELVVALVSLEEGGVGAEGGISSSFGCSFEQELGDRTHSTWGRLREGAGDDYQLEEDHLTLHRLIAMVVAKGGGGAGDRAGRLQQDSHSARFGIAVTGLEDALFILCALEEEYRVDGMGKKERAVDDVDIATAALYFLFAPRVLAQASANQ
ncbi:MAG: hypothetical protein M1831_005551 [Alyxoria varia]|nr:MAG: hypothetical protein M1831_005551 [Alyxoria varia]